jgi:hypothetical protein
MALTGLQTLDLGYCGVGAWCGVWALAEGGYGCGLIPIILCLACLFFALLFLVLFLQSYSQVFPPHSFSLQSLSPFSFFLMICLLLLPTHEEAQKYVRGIVHVYSRTHLDADARLLACKKV